MNMKLLSLAVLYCALMACGGGGGDSPSQAPTDESQLVENTTVVGTGPEEPVPDEVPPVEEPPPDEPHIPVESLFRVDFNSGVSPYGFEAMFVPEEPAWYSANYLPTGGYDNSPAIQIIANQGNEQFRLGWYWNGTRPGANWDWNDTVYVRFRIRFDDTYRWDGTGSQQNKMVDFGGSDEISRVILHNERPGTTSPCTLNYAGGTSYTPADYGLTTGAFDSGEWGSFAIKRGITETCTPPVAVTYGTWYHIQLAVKVSSASGVSDGEFRLWINNNNQTGPSTELLNIQQGVSDWNNSWDFGGYWTHANTIRDQGWRVDDFEVSEQFDPNWSPASAVAAPSLF